MLRQLEDAELQKQNDIRKVKKKRGIFIILLLLLGEMSG